MLAIIKHRVITLLIVTILGVVLTIAIINLFRAQHRSAENHLIDDLRPEVQADANRTR